MTALDKVDLLEEGGREKEEGGVSVPAWAREGVPVSAARGWGLEELRSRVEVALAGVGVETVVER